MSSPPSVLVWHTLDWISTFGLKKARSQLRSRPDVDEAQLMWIGAVSSVTAARLLALTWCDRRWYWATPRWLSDVSGGPEGIRPPWQTPLYSFNLNVLKWHLTQIEVAFFCWQGKKNDTEENSIRKAFFLILNHSVMSEARHSDRGEGRVEHPHILNEDLCIYFYKVTLTVSLSGYKI